MIRRLADGMARGASLIVTDRRWGATLSAAALGFGLFVGVAIGPGATGSLATGPLQLIEMPSIVADGGGPDGSTGKSASSAPLASAAPETTSEEPPLEALPSALPFESEAGEAPPVEGHDSEPVPPPREEPAEAESTQLQGTVVHANRAAGSYALAIKGGELVPVHARKLPVAGTKLSLVARRLANGTFAVEESKPELKGEAAQATFRGVVTFVNPDPLAPAYTVSGRGASLFVQVPPDSSGAVPTFPSLGSYVTARVAVEPDGRLAQLSIEIEPGEPSTYLDLAGIYAGLHPETGQLLLSVDDTRAGEQDLSLSVPPTIDPTKLKPGDSYLATATIEPDGSLRLAGIASDERTKGADDPTLAQGDLATGKSSGQ
jgi:hypothetical protein